MNIRLLRIVFIISAFFFLAVSADGQRIRERINSIKNADPFAISGSVGAGLGLSYNSNQPGCTPFSSNLYASLNLSFYGFQLPVSFYLNNNTTSFSYPQMPTFHLGFMPTWKNFKFHIGSSSMHFSNYTYSGLTFLGLGMEYQGKLFRTAVFGGVLNRPTKIKGYDDRSAFQQLADSLLGLNTPYSDIPQYRRDALGLKLGIGNERNFIDISVIKAKDRINTLPEVWRDSIPPKDNFAIGLSGRFAIRQWFSMTANLGASILTGDLRDSVSPILTNEDGVRKALQKTDWLVSFRDNTILRFAGDAAMNFNAGIFSANLTYRFIQPDYESLGASDFSQNSHSLGAVMSLRLFKGRSNISAVGYVQRDNLNKKQMYMNQVATYSLNWNNSFGQLFSLGFSYSGIKQDQYNGTMLLTDSLKINQIAHTVNLSPSFTWTQQHTHSITLTANFVQNKNLNPKYSNDINAQTLTTGITYGIDLEAIRLGIDAGYDFSLSSSTMAEYHSHGLNTGVHYRILSKEKLNWNLNYNGNVAYNIQTKGDIINNFSVGNSIGSSLSYDKHAASLAFSISNYSDREIIGQRVKSDLDCRFTFSYSYSFAAKVIKKMTKEERQQAKITRKANKLMKQSIKQKDKEYEVIR